MTTGIIVWLILFGIAALLFFGTAVVITVIGFQDLKDLLTHSRKKNTDAQENITMASRNLRGMRPPGMTIPQRKRTSYFFIPWSYSQSNKSSVSFSG